MQRSRARRAGRRSGSTVVWRWVETPLAPANRTMLAKDSGSRHHRPGAAPPRGGLVDDRRSDRSLALAGIVFVVLMLIAAFLPGSPPKPNDSAAKIVKFVTDKNDQLRWSGFVGVLASIVLLGWLGAVWRLLRRAEGGVVRLAV